MFVHWHMFLHAVQAFIFGFYSAADFITKKEHLAAVADSCFTHQVVPSFCFCPNSIAC